MSYPRFRVYVVQGGKVFEDAAYAAKVQAFDHAETLRHRFKLVCVREVLLGADDSEDNEVDLLLLRNGEQVFPLPDGRHPRTAPLRPAVAAGPATSRLRRFGTRALVDGLTLVMLGMVALWVAGQTML
ncbi:MAG TPA: hypothetical protein VEH84_17110 [Alphaproteobacteria bacterium]|nr:hypothetical protein [Alphaproteobacteria bacterium]